MKLITKRETKRHRLNNIIRYIDNWTILRENTKDIKWSLFKYWWLVTVLKRYDIIKVSTQSQFLAMIVLKRFEAQGLVLVERLIVPDKGSFNNSVVLNEIKHVIQKYTVLNFSTISIVLDYREHRLIRMIQYELDFEENTTKNLAYLLTAEQQDQLTFFKTLNK